MKKTFKVTLETELTNSKISESIIEALMIKDGSDYFKIEFKEK